MVFFKASPLRELVWVPSKGSSLKYVGSDIGMTDHSASVFRKTESTHVIMSPAQNPDNENSWRSNSQGDLKVKKPEVNYNHRSSHKVEIDVDEEKASFSEKHSKSHGSDSIERCEELPNNVAEENACDSDFNEILIGKNHQKPIKFDLEESVKIASCSHSAEDGCAGLDADGAKGSGVREFNTLSRFNLCDQRSLGNAKSSIMVKEIEITSAVRPLSQVAPENETAQDIHIDKQLVVRPHSPENLNKKRQRKGKEKIQFEYEECANFSNGMKDSNESVESSNSQSKMSKGKRQLNFDSGIFLRSKRCKLDSSEGSCSRSLVKRNSSFMNWMSTITSSGFGQLIPSDSCQKSPKGTAENIARLEDKKIVAVERPPLGFTNVFLSLYSSSSIMKNISDHKTQDDSSDKKDLNFDYPLIKGHQFSNPLKQKSNEIKECNDIEDLSESDDGHHNAFCKDNDVSKRSEFDQDVDKVEEYPLHTSLNEQTEVKRTCGRELSLIKMVHAHSLAKNSICTEDFKSRMPDSAPSSTPEGALNSSKDFSESLWVSRFLRKDSSLIVRPISYRVGIELENETQTKKSSDSGSKSQDNQFNNDCIDAGNRSISIPDCQNNITSEEIHQATTGTAGTVLSNLWRPELLPCKMQMSKSKSPEPMASLFGKRLDALKNIAPEKIHNELEPCAPRTCNLLDKNEINFQGSFGKDETDSKDKQLVFENYIHQLMKSNETTDSPFMAAQDGFKFIYGKTENHNNCKERSSFSGCQEHQKGSENIKSQLVSRLHNNSNCLRICSIDKITSPVTSRLYSLDDRDDKTIASEKQLALTGTRDNQLTPFFYSVTSEISDEQVGTFESIKRLRLSRSEVNRLLKSSKAYMTLKGFFLRLRLGKWEKGLGGTGYHVARINGAGCGKNISVSVGCFTCTVDSRFVSNHDYLEDELKAWWSAASKSGEIPSREELARKMNEKIMLGF